MTNDRTWIFFLPDPMASSPFPGNLYCQPVGLFEIWLPNQNLKKNTWIVKSSELSYIMKVLKGAYFILIKPNVILGNCFNSDSETMWILRSTMLLELYDHSQQTSWSWDVNLGIKTILALGTSLVVKWLRLHPSNAGDAGLSPGQGTKIPHAAWPNKQTISTLTELRSKLV